jgi:hypothetical protein
VSTSRVIFRLLISYVLASLFLSSVTWVALGPRAFILCPALVLAGTLAFWFSLESRLIAFCEAEEIPSPGLSHSYRRALEEAAFAGPPPGLRVIPSPTLQLLIVRSLGGTGLVLVSQGVLGLLSENELRALLSRAALRTKRPDTPARSLASWIALLLLGNAPSQWLSVTYEVAPDRAAPGTLTPASVFRFLLFLPLIRFFVAMSMLHPIERLIGPAAESSRGDLDSALHKIHRAIRAWRLTSTPIRYPFL